MIFLLFVWFLVVLETLKDSLELPALLMGAWDAMQEFFKMLEADKRWDVVGKVQSRKASPEDFFEVERLEDIAALHLAECMLDVGAEIVIVIFPEKELDVLEVVAVISAFNPLKDRILHGLAARAPMTRIPFDVIRAFIWAEHRETADVLEVEILEVLVDGFDIWKADK